MALSSAMLSGLFPATMAKDGSDIIESDLITEPIDINMPKAAAEPNMYWPIVFMTPFGAP